MRAPKGAPGGYEVLFEAQLRAAGGRPITSRPYHPQTCGKVERFQQTPKNWLRRHPAATLGEQPAAIEELGAHYHHERPPPGHRPLDPVGPLEGHDVGGRPHHGGPSPTLRRGYVVTADGCVSGNAWTVQLGRDHAGRPGVVVTHGPRVRVFIDGRLVRDLDLDPGRHHHGNGEPRGRRRRDHIRRETAVGSDGNVTVASFVVACGAEHAGRPAVVELVGGHVSVVVDGEVVGDFDLDTTKRHQPSGRPRGPRPRRQP